MHYAHPWIWWIVVGLVAGVLAKAIMPGNRKPEGCIVTILLGIAGSLLTGFVMRHFLHDSGSGGLAGTICGATIGAAVLLLIFRKAWS